MTHSVVVFEDHRWSRFLPIVYTRPTFLLMSGMGTLRDRIVHLIQSTAGRVRASSSSQPVPARAELWCRPELTAVACEQTGTSVNRRISGRKLLLNGRGFWKRLPDVDARDGSWVGTVGAGDDVACLFADADLSARLSPAVLLDEMPSRELLADLPRRDVSADVSLFDWPWELIHHNSASLEADWQLRQLSLLETRARIDAGACLLASERIRVGRNARVMPFAVINAESGPVWIGENVVVQPHSFIEGPAYIGNGCVIKAGAVIHPETTIGPRSKVGGEVEASIIQGDSNKQHDGFLGHSYVGSWVNVAAGCVSSDLKNTYGEVRCPLRGTPTDTGTMFLGLIAGDHAKLGVNVCVPTGAVIGFCSSIVGRGCPKFVPSFTWVEEGRLRDLDPLRGAATARKMMGRRGREMSAAENRLFLSTVHAAKDWEHDPESIGPRDNSSDHGLPSHRNGRPFPSGGDRETLAGTELNETVVSSAR